MKKRMIFCSHGRLCEGMLDTLKVFSLDQAMMMQAIPFYTENVDSEALLKQTAASITSEDEVLIFTDIAYGSVHQQVMLKFMDWENVTVLSGMNLALVLELASSQQPWSMELIETKIQTARSSILCSRSLSSNISEEDE